VVVVAPAGTRVMVVQVSRGIYNQYQQPIKLRLQDQVLVAVVAPAD
jgi:hypothetical protein